MSNVWKVASRWSDSGTAESSVLDIFRTHNIVFVGRAQETFKQIAIGDLVVISDGKRVVAMGKVMSQPQPITDMNLNFTEDETKRFHIERWVWGCRLSFQDLIPEEYVSYRIGTCHRVSERAKQFLDLYERTIQNYQIQNQFSISSRCCVLLDDVNKNAQTLFSKGISFRVPIYQRPYSWKEEQVTKLMTDLLDGFLGENGKYPNEPIFIGTMQLTEKKSADTKEEFFYEVIDGQQRLSTLILVLKMLQEKCSSSHIIQKLNLSTLLETRVNSGEQNRYFKQAMVAKFESADEDFKETQNPYCAVFQYINGSVGSYENEKPIDFERLAEYVLRQVYFVVIETRAGLSKTLQIFDSINRAGMDLSGGDVFKVRYYEYLSTLSKADESTFERISALYQSIDQKNESCGKKVTSIEQILSYYQHILIARHQLPSVLHRFSSTTFFERLFDTALRINEWDYLNYESIKNVRVEIQDLAELIDLRFKDHSDWIQLPEKSKCSYYFIWWSRYPQYSYLAILYRFAFKNCSQEKLHEFIQNLAKLLVIWSICRKKTVNEIHSFMWKIQSQMFDLNQDVDEPFLFKKVKEKIQEEREDRNLQWYLENEDFAHNSKAKNLVCRLSAMLEDDSNGLAERLFESEIDIEHIEPANNQDGSKRQSIWDEWKSDLHGLGNLILLERSINRSIGNKGHTEKMSAYQKSQFAIVRDFAQNHSQWNLSLCEERKKEIVKKINHFLLS